ncbi:MAG TPA: hypothetical protein DEU95_08095 [Chloroflexi bacterium]|jgi:alkylhydroperoxidase family enzyme|nr:hypothetical protein [Chloroflexota bacterium]HBY46476.1 hypothetical protein [Chloroflexota bacterium]HCG29687.1 hypothetical protein [Chloroflexota bacterium]HRA31717.1 hypothetical protein [Thermomicrobiales bacterium]
MDLNAAVGSHLGATDAQLDALLGDDWLAGGLFDEREQVALAYADAITYSDRDVNDDLFARVRAHFDDDAIIELTETIAWENASSKFNRALRVRSSGLWKRRDGR